MSKEPKVGVGVMILKGNKILFAKRKGSHGEGEYAFPGGHLEFGESYEDCAKRETKEESGIEIDNVQFQFLANIKTYSGKHYVHIGLRADWKEGEPKALEPDKADNWAWYDMDTLPSPMFEPCKLSLESYQSCKQYFDA
jgi:8-oxo-dGTP diphosphatase